MVVLCGGWRRRTGSTAGRLRFEIQVETPPAVLGADGAATVARLIHAADGPAAPACTTAPTTTAPRSASRPGTRAWSTRPPTTPRRSCRWPRPAPGCGCRDGSTNVLPVGDTAPVRAAWALHARLVRRSLERGFYQGWDLHPAQLPTRLRGDVRVLPGRARRRRRDRLARLPRRRRGRHGVLDEPATARALAGFLLRGLDCGALDEDEIGLLTGVPTATLDDLALRRVG